MRPTAPDSERHCQTPDPQEPPDLSGRGGRRVFYGWFMVPIATLGLIATAPAQTFGISAFNESFRESLGLSHSELTGAYMLGTFLASLPLSYIGRLMDRFGLRRTFTVVIVLFASTCMLTSQVRGLMSIFLAFFFLRMFGQGAVSMLSANTLAFWFERRLGMVEGVRNVGMAGAIAVVPAFNLWLIDELGWRGAYATLGLLVLAVMGPLMFFFRNEPADVGQRVDGAARNRRSSSRGDEREDTEGEEAREEGSRAGRAEPAAPGVSETDGSVKTARDLTVGQAVRTRSFWIVTSSVGLWAMLATAVLFNILPLFEQRGLSEADAARLFTVFALTLAPTQLIGGVLADRLPLNGLISAGVAALAAAMAILWRVQSPEMVNAAAVAMGLGQGLLLSSSGPLWPRYYGRSHLGQLRGLITTLMVGASSVGPFILGLCQDLLGSYDAAMTLFAVLPLPLIVLAWFATPPNRSKAPSTA